MDLPAIVAGIIDPGAMGIDNADAFIRKTERSALGRKLNNLLHGPAGNLFQGGTPLEVAQLCQPADPTKVPLNVFYLNALVNDDMKHFFMASLAAEIYRWMVSTGTTTGRPRLLFYLDEARDYIPAGTAKPPAKMPLIRLFTQGRKYGVACLMCTQSPRSVDYNVFGNCSTKVIGRLEAAQDAERVAEWFAQTGSPPAWLKTRAGARPALLSPVGREWPLSWKAKPSRAAICFPSMKAPGPLIASSAKHAARNTANRPNTDLRGGPYGRAGRFF